MEVFQQFVHHALTSFFVDFYYIIDIVRSRKIFILDTIQLIRTVREVSTVTVHHQHNNAFTQVDISTILVWCNPRERIARYNATFSLSIVGVSMNVKPLCLYIRFGEITAFLRTKHVHINSIEVIQHNGSRFTP